MSILVFIFLLSSQPLTYYFFKTQVKMSPLGTSCLNNKKIRSNASIVAIALTLAINESYTFELYISVINRRTHC